MKKIKNFALGILGAVCLTAGLHSCNNDEANSARQEKTEQKSLKSATIVSNLKVGKMEDGRVIPYFDPETFKEHFLEYDF